MSIFKFDITQVARIAVALQLAQQGNAQALASALLPLFTGKKGKALNKAIKTAVQAAGASTGMVAQIQSAIEAERVKQGIPTEQTDKTDAKEDDSV
jgi:hypothetical protein